MGYLLSLLSLPVASVLGVVCVAANRNLEPLHLGCYNEDVTDRAMEGKFFIEIIQYPDGLTPLACVADCIDEVSTEKTETLTSVYFCSFIKFRMVPVYEMCFKYSAEKADLSSLSCVKE